MAELICKCGFVLKVSDDAEQAGLISEGAMGRLGRCFSVVCPSCKRLCLKRGNQWVSYYPEDPYLDSPPAGYCVKQGTFLYEGSVRCAVEIWRTDFRPGSGDYEDPESIREDARGTFFEIRYASPGQACQPAGGWCESLQAAISAVESAARDVRWSD